MEQIIIPDGPLLSLKDLAERWDISENTIYKWRVSGKGPRGMKLGRHLRFKLSDVEAFEESRMEERPQS